MASTTALFTGLTGLNAHAKSLDVIGNNIANVNTTAFKSTRMLFSTMFNRTVSEGTPPGDVTGGTNPFQVGLGVNIGGTQRNMNSGTISVTGDQRDMAVDGSGFFVVRRGETDMYTRAGAFRANADNELTNISGDRLMGYGVDAEFNIASGQLVPLKIPLGQLTIAEATRNVRLSGNLDADGALPSLGSIINLLGTATEGLRAIALASPPPGVGNLLETVTRLIDIEDPRAPGSGTPLFSQGQQIEVRSAQKGGKLVPSATLDVGAGSTMQDLLSFLAGTLGIDTSTGANPDGNTPGVTLDPSTGMLRIVGNTGVVNDLAIDSSDIRTLDATGAVVGYPFVPSKVASSDGEGVRTTFIAYDSLGTPVEVDVTMTLESRGDNGTVWRYYVESPDHAGPTTQAATGTVAFDNEGQLVSTAPVTVTINRSGSGAVTPLTFSLSLGSTEDNVTALTDDRSEIAATFRDGSPIGTLTGFGVGVDGTIVGAFTNGLTRTLGQVVLATFTNPEGLVEQGSNLFSVGANSGVPAVTTPGTFSAGRIISGSLELSNVDLGEEFIKMILTSTGYSANSRVIRTTDELMQQLLVIGR
jgi:flagellar hook protein FlgE